MGYAPGESAGRKAGRLSRATPVAFFKACRKWGECWIALSIRDIHTRAYIVEERFQRRDIWKRCPSEDTIFPKTPVLGRAEDTEYRLSAMPSSASSGERLFCVSIGSSSRNVPRSSRTNVLGAAPNHADEKRGYHKRAEDSSYKEATLSDTCRAYRMSCAIYAEISVCSGGDLKPYL